MPTDIDEGIHAFADELAAYICPPEGDTMRVRVNPPPPPPAIKVMVLYGPVGSSTSTIARHLAHGLGFQHLDIGDHLMYLNTLPHDDVYRKKALCNLDRYAFEDMMAKGRYPTPLLLAEVVRQKIDEEVAAGHRKFVVGGMPEAIDSLWYFNQKVAEPNAIIFLEGSQSQQWRQKVASYHKSRNEHKVLFVPVVQDDVEQTYQSLLLALATKAHVNSEPMRQDGHTCTYAGHKNSVLATVATRDAKIERKDTPMQDAAGKDLLDDLESALTSAPDP